MATDTATLTAASVDPAATATDALTGTGVAFSHIYWADFLTGTVNAAGQDGSNPHAIVTGQDQPFGVAVDASHLYWGNFGHGAGGHGAVWVAGLDGTSPHIIVRQDCTVGVAVGPAQLYWIAACVFTGTIHEAGLDGSNPQTLLTDQGGPQWLAVGP
jgi:hypothetical protein